MKKFLSVILCVWILAAIVTLTTGAATLVNVFNITVTAPRIGDMPSYSGSVPQTASTTVTKVEWDGTFGADGTFISGEPYTVKVTCVVKPNTNKNIKFIEGDAKINNYTASLVSLSSDKQTIVLCYTFKKAEKKVNNTETDSSKILASSFEDLSFNENEWEVLRLVNVERAKEGLYLLSMTQALQYACNVREPELLIVFEHKRPDQSSCFTAIGDYFKWKKVGENIAKGQRSPAQVMDSWMNSPGHRANILDERFGYIGVGFYQDGNAWVQLFASRKDITNITTSTKKTTFTEEEIRDHYLCITTADGYVSYMPLDFNSMTKNADGTYSPNLPASNLPSYVKLEPGTETPQFIDVAPNAYYAQAVKWAVERKITVGTSATNFSPDNTCTRAQIITFLWRAVGSPKVSSANPFSDVKTTDYYYDSARWAYKKGMVTESAFNGDTPCTRAATVVYLWKNDGSPKSSYSGNFIDVSSDAEYASAVAWAVSNKITSGTSETTFSPDMTCTRGQIVTFLNRTLK